MTVGFFRFAQHEHAGILLGKLSFHGDILYCAFPFCAGWADDGVDPFQPKLSRAHILYIMCRPFLLLDPSFIFSRPHSAVFQPVALRHPKKFEKSFPQFLHIRKKCVPLHSLSGMTRGLMRKRSLKGLGYKTNTRRNIEASAGPFFSDEQIKNIIQCRV